MREIRIKTRDKIVILYIVIFMFPDIRREDKRRFSVILYKT
jgi:hypothetical protein